MTASAAPSPQTTIYETVIEDAAVEQALEERQKRRDSAKAVNKKYREADAAAKAALEQLDLGNDAPVRIGRFVVTRKQTASRSVSFETAPGVRVNIKAISEEG